MDGDFLSNFRTFNGGGGAAAALTLQAASGNASITVDSGATGNLNLGWSGTGTAGGALILGSNLDIIHNGSGNLTFSRQITGANGLTKTGTGTLIAASGNANSFSGAANFNGGRAIFANTGAATGDLNSASAVNLGGGTLEIRTTSALNKTLTPNTTVSVASTLAYNNTTGTTQTLSLTTGSMVLNADLTVQNISATTTLNNGLLINRNMTGAGNLIVETYNNVNSGTASADFVLGRVALGGSNSAWSGNLVISEGTAQLFGDTALGQFNAGSGDIILGETGNSFGAGFLVAASTPTAGAKTLSNDIIVRSGGFRTLRGGSDHTYTFSGSVTLEGDLNVHNGLFFTDKNMILTGDISGVGGLSITESGNPNFTRLTGSNTYTGATTIGAGAVLNIQSASGNAIGDSSAVTFDGAGASLVFNTTDETVGSIASSGTNGVINLGANMLTTGGNNADTTYGGTVSGTGGRITKTGTGTMTLSGVNTYTGATTVTSGRLIINGDNSAASGNVTVAAGASLGGSGTIGGATTISGIHDPGTSPGIQSFTSGLVYNSGAVVNWELTADTASSADRGNFYDGIDLLGTANLNFAGATTMNLSFNSQGSTVTWSGAFWTANRSWLVYDMNNGVASNFDNFQFNTADWADSLGDTFNTARPGSSFGLAQTGEDIFLVYTVPEPSTYGLLGLAVVALAGRVIARRRQTAR
jgi:autotransporter-associated beta strand protein